MELLDYLQANFVTREKLIEQTGVDDETLHQLQQSRCMPQCSYRVTNGSTCTSPIANLEWTDSTEFFARGYGEWLLTCNSSQDSNTAFNEFASRYRARVSELLKESFHNFEPGWFAEWDKHIQTEWGHFLAGTYGVCTRTGLPEDVATKELAAARITDLISRTKLNADELSELDTAIKLMDGACSDFAPHERAESSRVRLIEDVRQRFNT